MKVRIVAGNPLECPCHGLPEVNPNTGKLFIRGYKVLDGGHWWSQCLLAAGFYTIVDGKFTETPDKYDASKGWF